MSRSLSLITFPDAAPRVSPHAASPGVTTAGHCRDSIPERGRRVAALANSDGCRYLDARGAASYLALTKKAVYHRVSRRTIPYIRVGRLLRFDRDALDRWMRKSAVDSRHAPVARCAKVQTPRAIAA
jgi:excisionase family DNA binding protein